MSKTPYAIDWENREFIEVVSANMKVLTEFLNKFGVPCSSLPAFAAPPPLPASSHHAPSSLSPIRDVRQHLANTPHVNRSMCTSLPQPQHNTGAPRLSSVRTHRHCTLTTYLPPCARCRPQT